MKKYLLVLFVSLFAIALSSNAFAYSNRGEYCGSCHSFGPWPPVENTPPVADAGPNQSVDEGVTVTMNGSNSDDSDDGIDSYLWEQVGETVSVAISNPAAVKPTFNTPNVGPGGAALTFRLTVTDASGATNTDTTIVNVSWVNIEPVADAGDDRTVAESTPVTLDGSASNGVDDGIATYSWKQVNINGVIADLVGLNTPEPKFTITDVGTNGESLTFELTVTDDGGLQATDRCVVNVTNINQVPVANAGADQTVAANDEVILDASGSYDPDNDINPDNAYTWKQTAGTAVTLSAPGAIYPAFTAPAVADGSSETLVFELTVTDSGLLQATDICEILVNGATPPPAEDPPVEDPPAEDPPAEDPPAEDPPAEDPPVEDPPAEDPPAEDPPAEDPPVEDPPAEDPPAEDPPAEDPPVIEPPVTEVPPVVLMEKYKRLAKKYFKKSGRLNQKSRKYIKLYRRSLNKDQAAAKAYKSKAMVYKAQSLDAKWKAKNYLKLYKQIEEQLDADHHGDERDRDSDDDGDDDDRDRDRDRDDDDDDDDDDDRD